MQDYNFWDEIASSYSPSAVKSPFRDYGEANFFTLTDRWCSNLEGKSVLLTDLSDEYAGKNLYISKIARKNNVTGIDISEAITTGARKNLEIEGIPLRCIVADAITLPFKPESFDLILSPSTIDHCPKRLLPRALKGFKRVLKKEGQIIISFHNGHCVSMHVRKPNWCFPAEFYSMKELKDIFHKVGLRVESVTAINHVPFLNITEGIVPHICWEDKNILKFLCRQGLGALNLLERVPTKWLTGTHLAFDLRKVR